MNTTPIYDVHVARYPDPTPIDAEGNDATSPVRGPIVDIDVVDIAAAIKDAGWCEAYTWKGEPAAIVPHGDPLPKAARAYLRGR